jgi:hypothetical protein
VSHHEEADHGGMGGECCVAVPRTQAEQHHVAGHDAGEDTSETEEADRIEATTGHGEQQQPTGVLPPRLARRRPHFGNVVHAPR